MNQSVMEVQRKTKIEAMPPRPRITHQKAASEAMPPVPPQMFPRISTISPIGGERSNAADAQAVRRQTTVTRAPRSRARLQHEPTRRRLMAQPCTPHLHCAARAALQAANPQWRGQGAAPLAFSWGSKGAILSRERMAPLLRAAPSALPLPPAPCAGNSLIRWANQKSATFFEKPT